MYIVDREAFLFMIIHGSMSHTYSGRKRKSVRGRKTKHVVRSSATVPTYSNYRETPHYPSHDSMKHNTGVDANLQEKLEVAKNYTVAVAYNKGAYQVVSKENIKHIGK